MRSLLVAWGMSCLALGVGSATQRANTLSEAYDEAFANPKGFDWYVLEQKDPFFDVLAACARGAIPVLAAIERDLHQEYGRCKENSECTEIAKEIAGIAEARGNVGTLATSLEAMRRPHGPAFAETEAGKRAFVGFEVLKRVTKQANDGLELSDDQITSLIRGTPGHRAAINALGTVPCK